MTSERRSAAGSDPEAPPVPAEPLPPALRLQILSSEHSALVATRSLAWSEVFARASTYLSVVAAATVALALMAQGSGFGTTFLVFGIVILPVVLVLGVTTHARMGASNAYEAQCVVGMNRIRRAYLELAPDLAPYFVMSSHDDPQGVAISEGVLPGIHSALYHYASTPMVISIINSVVAAALGAMVAVLLAISGAWVLVAGIGVFALAVAGHLSFGGRNIRLTRSWSPQFPDDPRGSD